MRVFVFGGGFSGLCSAALLAKEGIEVTLFEQRGRLGGNLVTFTVEETTFEFGPHLVFNPGLSPVHQVFERLELPHHWSYPPGAKLWRKGQLESLPMDWRQFAFGGQSWQAKKDIGKLWWEFSKVKAGGLPDNDDTSLIDFIQKYTHQREVIDYLQSIAFLMFQHGQLEHIRARDFILHFQLATESERAVGYPRKGFGSIIKALERKLLEYGGSVELSSSLKRVQFNSEHSLIQRVLVDDQWKQADVYLFSLPAYQLAQIEGMPSRKSSLGAELWVISYDFLLRKPMSDEDHLIFTKHPYTVGLFKSNLEPSLCKPCHQMGSWLGFQTENPFARLEDVEAVVRQQKNRLKETVHQIFPEIPEWTIWKRISDPLPYSESLPGKQFVGRKSQFEKVFNAVRLNEHSWQGMAGLNASAQAALSRTDALLNLWRPR